MGERVPPYCDRHADPSLASTAWKGVGPFALARSAAKRQERKNGWDVASSDSVAGKQGPWFAH